MERELTIYELREIYRKLTGKRPMYAKEYTKGYTLFLKNLSLIRFGKAFK